MDLISGFSNFSCATIVLRQQGSRVEIDAGQMDLVSNFDDCYTFAIWISYLQLKKEIWILRSRFKSGAVKLVRSEYCLTSSSDGKKATKEEIKRRVLKLLGSPGKANSEFTHAYDENVPCVLYPIYSRAKIR